MLEKKENSSINKAIFYFTRFENQILVFNIDCPLFCSFPFKTLRVF